MPKKDGIEKINGNFKGKDIISIDQFTPKDIEILFKVTKKMKNIAANAKPSDILKGNLVTLLFYEPSSRTFGSFAAGIKQLGGQTIEIRNPQQVTSEVKGETFEDTIRVFEAYCDAIVIRHPEIGKPKRAAEIAQFIPVINAGDGAGDHPTQTLYDLYTLQEKFKRLDNLKGVIGGGILKARAIYSLVKGLSLYKGNAVYLFAPKELQMPEEDLLDFKKRGLNIIKIEEEEEIPKDANFWYWVRIQKERFENTEKFEKIKDKFLLTPQFLEKHGNKNLIIMHCLPRVGEVLPEIDNDLRAVYLRSQVRNGMYIRMALIALILGKIK